MIYTLIHGDDTITKYVPIKGTDRYLVQLVSDNGKITPLGIYSSLYVSERVSFFRTREDVVVKERPTLVAEDALIKALYASEPTLTEEKLADIWLTIDPVREIDGVLYYDLLDLPIELVLI